MVEVGRSKNECERELTDIRLEDVARCDYFRRFRAVPTAGLDVRIRETTVDGRIVVESVSGNVIIGLLPTRYHYLLPCIAGGYSYEGTVEESTRIPIPSVTVSLQASR